MKKLGVLLLILAMSGCAAPSAHFTRAGAYMESGNCDAAIQVISSSVEERPGARAFYLGGIYHDCKHDNATAIRYMTLAARYGIASAQEALVSVGAPVPPADLARSNTSGGVGALDLLNAAVQGWNEGRAQARTKTITCTSRKTVTGDGFETDCR